MPQMSPMNWWALSLVLTIGSKIMSTLWPMNNHQKFSKSEKILMASKWTW